MTVKKHLLNHRVLVIPQRANEIIRRQNIQAALLFGFPGIKIRFDMACLKIHHSRESIGHFRAFITKLPQLHQRFRFIFDEKIDFMHFIKNLANWSGDGPVIAQFR